MAETINLYILSGFLGSGKSTLLKILVEKEKLAGKKVAVLMNELGEYSVDSEIIGSDLTILELLDGCICCTMKDELEVQLLELYRKEQPDVIFIEATGVAHPVDILDACLSPVLAPYMVVQPILTVVDSKRWMHRGELSPPIQKLLEEQVKYADHILLNKADTVSPQEMNSLQLAIKELNPTAQQSITLYAKTELIAVERAQQTAEGQHRETMHVVKNLRIQSLTYTFQNEIERSDFEKWVAKVSTSLFRLKGFLRFTGENPTFLIQMAYGKPFTLALPINLPMNLVIIGENLDKEQIKKELAALENDDKTEVANPTVLKEAKK
ncbi:GTP-binding protein [Planococcus sp. ISL-109]|uniref:CobW family GTP-binding protein n=1 Tax=Planococcus sp. ISL-109 TaxID=2819166 RepID=UPI001BE4FAE6|nr:GTP-binding protein [Planococcus sp. ISL-109]MBT2583210.1 GTP-binding protein [Planococcus sp. ISL-109]